MNIYAPNGLGKDKIDFFEDVIQTVLELKATHDCEATVVAGDFNLVFNDDEVKDRLITNNEKRLANSVAQIFCTAELKDGWTAAGSKEFTWSTNRNGKQIFSTLDRIMFSETKLILRKKEVDWSLSLSDHAMVLATFTSVVSNRKPCNFIPRLDPRILEDTDARRILDQEFESLMNNASADWTPHVALEYCKMSMRTAVFTTTGKIKARFRNEEKELNENINEIINELTNIDEKSSRHPLLVHKLDDLRCLKRQLVEKIGSKIEQRTARAWHNEGELSNKYFFNLLNRRTNEEINSLLIDNEQCCDGPKIEEAIRGFYKDLYESVGEPRSLNNDFFRNIDPIDDVEAEDVVRDLTLEELGATLKGCADSSPGPDGIPYSYLKYFWSTFGPILLRAWCHSLRSGELPQSHKLSYLRLIPKAGKDPRVINNLRPITLSNTDHKLITKTYARKLTSAVSKRISQEQTAYLPGRLINDNVRSMLMTLDLANLDETVDGIIVSLDAKKAFDSVDHDYIRGILDAFGLSRFKPIFNVLYNGLKSDIILNGGTIDGYKILKGVKQGDALSCIIFIMCMEPLIANIKSNPDIEGIVSQKLDIDIPKVYGYADDVNSVIKTSERALQSIFVEYERFSEQSGLILNAEKTELLRFKKTRPVERTFDVTYMGKEYSLATSNEIKVNGVLFFQDPKVREEKNVDKVIAAMTRHLMQWSRRHLTLLGKILILKTFAISQVVFLMQSMMLEDKSLKRINQLLFKFLWNKNFNAAKAPDRIKREVVLTPCKYGGFGMLDIFKMNESFNIRALGRMSNSEHPVFKQVWSDVKNSSFFNVRTAFAADGKLRAGLKLLNARRLDILTWSPDQIMSNASLVVMLDNCKLINVLTSTGRLSIPAHRVLNRRPNLKLKEITLAELASIERYLISPNLTALIRILIRQAPNLNLNGSVADASELYPTNAGSVVPMATLSSKAIREDLTKDVDEIICVYKSGLLLTPGEVLAWTKNVKKLTSTRHRCALLRIAHGDVYTNARLFRFGLIDNPKCANCEEASESLNHRFLECRAASTAWQILEGYIEQMAIPALNSISLERLLGVETQDRHEQKLALTLRTELATRLMTRGGKTYCPTVLAKASVRTILMVEKLSNEQKQLLTTVLNG